MDKDKVLQHIEEVDKKLEAPEDRAKKVLDILKQHNLTTWDVMCFCSEWLGMMIPVWPWLEPMSVRIAKLTQYAHYYKTDDIIAQEVELK